MRNLAWQAPRSQLLTQTPSGLASSNPENGRSNVRIGWKANIRAPKKRCFHRIFPGFCLYPNSRLATAKRAATALTPTETSKSQPAAWPWSGLTDWRPSNLCGSGLRFPCNQVAKAAQSSAADIHPNSLATSIIIWTSDRRAHVMSAVHARTRGRKIWPLNFRGTRRGRNRVCGI